MVRPLDQGSKPVGSTSGSATLLLCAPGHAARPLSFSVSETGTNLTFRSKGGCKTEVRDVRRLVSRTQGFLSHISVFFFLFTFFRFLIFLIIFFNF